jgi:PAS domain S-box-containing protein
MTVTSESRVSLPREEIRALLAYTLLEQALPDALFVHDDVGRFLEVNDAACDSVGYTREELLSMTVFDVERDFDPTSAQALWRQITPNSRTGVTGRHRRKDGTVFPVEVFFGVRLVDGHRIFVAVVRDRSEQERYTTKLLESESRYRTLFANVNVPFCECEMVAGADEEAVDCRLVETNGAFRRQFAVPEDPVGGVTLRGIEPGIDPFWIQTLLAVARSGQATQFQAQCGRAPTWYDVSAFVTGAGRVGVLLHDITAEKAPYTAQVSHFAAAEQLARIGSWSWDVATGTNFWSEELYRIFGYRPGEVSPDVDLFYATVVPEDRDDLRRAVSEALAGTERYSVECRVRSDRADGQYVLCRGRVERDAGGRPIRMAGTVTDVTDWVLRRQDLERVIHQQNAMVDNALVGIVRLANRVIVWANVASERLFGFPPGGMAGLPMRRIYPDRASYEAVGEQLYAAIAASGIYRGVIELLRADGSRLWVEVSVTRLAGTEAEHLAVFVDRTASKLARDELERHRTQLATMVEERTAALAVARDLAEDANRAKSAFLATVSHELRTPLNAITGFLAILLRRCAGDTGTTEVLRKVQGAASRLVQLVTDLLEAARIESGQASVHTVRFALKDALETVRHRIGPRMAERGLAWYLEIPYDLARQPLAGDRLRLEQVLLSLLDNAIKFTSSGSVELRVERIDDDDARLGIRVEVTDTGIGIAPADMPRIFEFFEQGDRSPTRRYGGAGLGLAISRRLVALLGGQMGVESEPGRGSTFWFTARFDKAEQTAGPSRDAETLPAGRELAQRHAGTRLLVVESDPFNRSALEALLEDVSLHADFSSNVDDAENLVRRGTYPLVLVALGSQRFNGREAVRRLRGLFHQDPPRILGLAADLSTRDRAVFLDAGVVDIVREPIVPDDLYGKISRSLAGASGAGPSAA